MPFQSHWRLTCSGVLGTSSSAEERFSFGVSLADDMGGGDADRVIQPNDGQFDDMVTDTTAFFGRAASQIAPHCRLTEVKLAKIGPDGRYLEDPFIAAVSQVGAGNFNIVYPPQVALAVSLNTSRRGATGRGRFYLPCPTVGLSTDTMVGDINGANSCRDSVKTWLDALNNEPGIDVVNFGVCVASSKGYNTAVTSVRVGRVLDTIRSRRRSLGEGYGPSAVLAVDS
jgi:hypothetical protein